jgi:hypothetical protein
VLGVSFAGGLAVAASSRPSMRDTLAYVVSFGGHGDLPRVMRYLATGEEAKVEGSSFTHRMITASQSSCMVSPIVVPCRRASGRAAKGIETFLLGSQQSMVDQAKANRTYAEAREYEKTLPEPSRTYMKYVNDRSVKKLGAVLEPHLNQLGANDPALSADRAEAVPAVPIYLMHGDDDKRDPCSGIGPALSLPAGKGRRRPSAPDRSRDARRGEQGRCSHRRPETDRLLGRHSAGGECSAGTPAKDPVSRGYRVASRAAEKLIADGRVSVNGATVREMGTQGGPGGRRRSRRRAPGERARSGFATSCSTSRPAT